MDLVYGSRETDLIVAARAAGATTVDGLEILARQGAASLRIWTGANRLWTRCAAQHGGSP